MDELIRWTDNDPTLRCYEIRFDSSHPRPYTVRVWDNAGFKGEETGFSLNFASVKALIAYDAAYEAREEAEGVDYR